MTTTETANRFADLMMVIQTPGPEFATSLVPGTPGDSPLILKDLPIFRSGNFRNSWGDEVEVSPYDIQLMVQNFNYLKESGRFDEPPVREGHRSSYSFGADPISSVIGHIVAVRSEPRKFDGEEFEYLLADMEIMREDAKSNIRSGLWRKRSAEIGIYKDNKGAEYAPTVMGLGFVDIPAVEGLDAFSYSDGKNDAVMISEETMKIETPPVVTGAGTATQMHQFTINGNPVQDPTTVQNHILKLEGDFAAASAQVTQLTAENTALNEFKSNTLVAVREGFIDQLVKDDKILAAQADGMKEFAKTLTPEQFTAYSEQFKDAPKQAVLGTHGVQESERPVSERGTDKEFSQSAIDRGVLRDLRASGQSDEQLKKTDMFSRLVKADANFTLENL